MQATSLAQPNIALVKYWGKRDGPGNLPATGSLSLTLAALETRMTVCFGDAAGGDLLEVNGAAAPAMLPRVSRCLDDLAGADRPPARVTSTCNFPIAAGLASSASAFAALVVAASHALGQREDRLALARIAGRASGSAARSLYPGFVELAIADDGVVIDTLAAAADWPLVVTVAVTATGAKPVSSTVAMNLSRDTSPFYRAWVERQAADLAAARAAVRDRDFARLADIAEHNCLKMHALAWTSRPAVVFWNAATLNCMETVRALRRGGTPVFFTIDAGPQVKALSPPDAAGDVARAFAETDGVIDVMQSGLGEGARLVEAG